MPYSHPVSSHNESSDENTGFRDALSGYFTGKLNGLSPIETFKSFADEMQELLLLIDRIQEAVSCPKPLKAVIQGDVQKIRALLADGLDPEFSDSVGVSMLIIAAQTNKEAVLDVLLEALEQEGMLEAVNAVASADGRTALHQAAQKGHTAIVNKLIQKGAALNPLDHCRNTPFSLALAHKHEETVKLFLENGVLNTLDLNDFDENGENILPLAVKMGDSVAVNAVLNFIKEKNPGIIKSVVDHFNHVGRTPLHAASQLGFAGIVKSLVEVGADVNAVDPDDGITPLHLAALFNHLVIADILLKNGANPTLKTTGLFSETVEELATACDHGEMIKKLHVFRSVSLRARYRQFRPAPVSVSPSHQNAEENCLQNSR